MNNFESNRTALGLLGEMNFAYNRTSIPTSRKYDHIEYKICVAVDSLLLVVMMLLTFSVTYYGIKTKRFRQRSRSDFNGGCVFTLAALCPVLTCVRLITSILFFTFPPYEDGADFECEVIHDITAVTYFTALLPIYILLWLRQRVLYKHPSMSSEYSRCVICISWGSIFFITATGLGILALFTIPVTEKSSVNGCYNYNRLAALPNMINAVLLVFGQVLILSLFVMPLKGQIKVSKQLTSPPPAAEGNGHSSPSRNGHSSPSRYGHSSPSRNEHSSPCSNETTITMTASTETLNLSKSKSTSHNLKIPCCSERPSTPETHKKSPGGRSFRKPRQRSKSAAKKLHKKKRETDLAIRITAILKRTLIFGSVCIASDVLAMMVPGVILPPDYPQNIMLMCYDVSLTINVFCIILSFENAESMILLPILGVFRKQDLTSFQPSHVQASTNVAADISTQPSMDVDSVTIGKSCYTIDEHEHNDV